MMNKAQEYKTVLRTKTDKELQTMRANLSKLISNHKAKNSPDTSMLGNYQWQLSIVNAELNSRNTSSDRMSQVEGAQKTELAVEKSDTGLAQKTVDELKDLWNRLKQAIANGLPEKELIATKSQADAVEAEIKTRSDQEKGVKGDIAKVNGKFWQDQSFWVSAGVGASMGAIVGWATGTKIWGWAIIGAAVGGGYNQLNK